MRRTEGEWLAWFTPHQRNRRKKGRPQAAFRVCDPALSHCNESALASEIGRQRSRVLSGSGAPECDGACDGSGPGPYGVAVVAALNDPLTVFLADNFPDVMPPDDDRADGRSTGVRPVAGPRSRQVDGRAGIAGHLATHVPAAPGARASGMMLIAVMAARMMVMGSRFSTRCKSTKQCRCS